MSVYVCVSTDVYEYISLYMNVSAYTCVYMYDYSPMLILVVANVYMLASDLFCFLDHLFYM